MAAKLKLEELANLCSFILHAHAMQGRSSRKRSCCPVIWNSVLQGLIIHTFSWGQHRLSGHINVSALEKSLSLVLLIQVGSPWPSDWSSLTGEGGRYQVTVQGILRRLWGGTSRVACQESGSWWLFSPSKPRNLWLRHCSSYNLAWLFTGRTDR